MTKNFCCVIWKSLSKELAKTKREQIDALVAQGVPESTFAPVLEVLDTMHNGCPCCATSTQAPRKETPAAPTAPSAPAPAFVPRKCGACKGYGTLSGKPRIDEEETNCMNCLGTGRIDNNTRKEIKVKPEIAEAMEERREEIIKQQKGKKIDTSFHDDDEVQNSD